jgi:hypothetical protein
MEIFERQVKLAVEVAAVDTLVEEVLQQLVVELLEFQWLLSQESPMKRLIVVSQEKNSIQAVPQQVGVCPIIHVEVVLEHILEDGVLERPVVDY